MAGLVLHKAGHDGSSAPTYFRRPGFSAISAFFTFIIPRSAAPSTLGNSFKPTFR